MSEKVPARPARVALAWVAAGALALASSPARADDGFTVVTYRCDGERHIAIGYPPDTDARSPIRVGWQGRTYLLTPTRHSMSTGSRYINGMANLEWWRGRSGTPSALSTVHNVRRLLTNCVAT